MKAVPFSLNLKTLRLAASTALVAVVLSACGKGFESKGITPNDAPQVTGGKDKNGTPYTAAGDSLELQKLKKEISGDSPANLALASKIEKVSVTRLDRDGKPVTAKPAKLEIQLVVRDLATGPLVFQATFTQAATIATTANLSTAPSAALSATLSIRCLDDDCNASVLRFKNADAEAGFIHRKRVSTVQALGPFDPAKKGSRLDKISEALKSVAQADFVTTEVAWGPALFDLTAGTLHAAGGLTQTGGTEEPVTVALTGEKSFEAKLLGNNNRGGLLIRVSDGGAWSFIRIILPEEKSSDDTGPIVVDNAGPSADKLINWNPAHPITAQFQKDLAKPQIQKLIQLAKAREHHIGRWLEPFINRVRPSVPMMSEILAKRNLPPELIFITMIESDYFRAEGFPVRTSKIKGRALSEGAKGPWQFMPKTAAGFKMKLEPCDERGDLAISTAAAARYFQYLFEKFPADPKLALMAYNWGQGNLGRALICSDHKDPKACSKQKISEMENFNKRIEQLQTAGLLDFWTIHEFNIAPKESTDYVMKFIVSQYLGREPVRHGFAYDGKTYPAAPQACPSK